MNSVSPSPFSPSPSILLQIGESLGKFGVNEDSKHLILARFDATPEEMQRLRELVEGEAAATGEAAVLVDVPLLTKYYKVQKEELEIGSLADAITSRIAARDCM